MYYIYQFLDKDDNVIYIGYTGDIRTRVKSQHFGGNGHLPEKCYQEVFMVLYSECISIDDAKIKERYLINKFSPKYNIQLKNNSRFSFDIEISNWKYIPINKQSLLKNKKVFLKKELYGHFDKSYKLSVICINNKIWTFWGQIVNFFENFSNIDIRPASVISIINRGFIDINDAAIISDDYLIKENLDSNYLNTTVLISLDSVEKLIDYCLEQESNKYKKKINRSGKIVFREYGFNSLIFYDFDEYKKFCIDNNTSFGEKIKKSQMMRKIFSQTIVVE